MGMAASLDSWTPCTPSGESAPKRPLDAIQTDITLDREETAALVQILQRPPRRIPALAKLLNEPEEDR